MEELTAYFSAERFRSAEHDCGSRAAGQVQTVHAADRHILRNPCDRAAGARGGRRAAGECFETRRDICHHHGSPANQQLSDQK